MISEELARRLHEAGLRWRPRAGDRFVIPGLEGQLFTLSDMTIEAHEYPTGTVLGFNGTTEWALDSVAQEDALWMPREDQLREMLRASFRSLVATADGRYVVTVRGPSGEPEEFGAATAEDAYATALLPLVSRATAPAEA